MKLAGLGLLLSGWIIAVAALPLLTDGRQRGIFVTAGIVVEVIGLVLLGRSHRAPAGDRT